VQSIILHKKYQWISKEKHRVIVLKKKNDKVIAHNLKTRLGTVGRGEGVKTWRIQTNNSNWHVNRRRRRMLLWKNGYARSEETKVTRTACLFLFFAIKKKLTIWGEGVRFDLVVGTGGVETLHLALIVNITNGRAAIALERISDVAGDQRGMRLSIEGWTERIMYTRVGWRRVNGRW